MKAFLWISIDWAFVPFGKKYKMDEKSLKKLQKLGKNSKNYLEKSLKKLRNGWKIKITKSALNATDE